MLKEVFVIEDGILQYHYSEDHRSDDSDQAVLSSGLLSAIRDFSAQARSDVLQSFATENEYFLFTVCDISKKIIVGVFDRKAPQQVARESLERMKRIIQEADLPDHTGEVLSKEKKLDLRIKIDRIATQLFGREGLVKYIEEILAKRTDIPLAFLVDSNDKSVLAHFARPRPLYNDNQVREFLLLHSTIQTTLTKLGLDANYLSFTVESSDYAVSSCRGGRLLSVASGAMRTPTSNVEAAAFEMCYESDTVNHLDKSQARSVSKNIIFENGIIRNETGDQLPSVARIFLSTLINNIDSFFRVITKRKFLNFEVRAGKEEQSILVIRRDAKDTGIAIDIYRF
ncbi:MAG: hypothetical protein ACFFEJ_17745 [Candidatus Thorarchaeota archaeon]